MKNRNVKLLGYIPGAVLLLGVVAPFSVQAINGEGWEQETDGHWYWYENGIKQGTEGRGKEIYDPDSEGWYWLDAVDGGKRAENKDVYQDSLAGEYADSEDGTGKWCRYDENGRMVKGWDVNGNGTYYFEPTFGAMLKGYWIIDSVAYNFDRDTGIMDYCGIGMNGNYWCNINGVQYWYENGIRQGYNKVDPSYQGKEIYDPDADAWFWLDNVQQGARAISKDVYQDSLAGPWAENEDGTGKWVRYDQNGHMVKGWDTNDRGTYYFDPIYGTMAKGTVEIEGITYNFDETTGVLLGNLEDEPEFSSRKVYSAIVALREDYPEGMVWTNADYYKWNGGVYYGGYGCAGFAFMLSDAAFGNLKARLHTDFDNIRVGDILCINDDAHNDKYNDEHWVIVLKVGRNGVEVAEGNCNLRVHWGREISFSDIKEIGVYIMTRYPE